MTEYKPMQRLPDISGYKTGDVLVLIGELFGRGYANGIVDEAKRIGMTIIGTTVGRRNSDNTLRPLLPAELAEAEKLLGGKIINIPLEAGFDMDVVTGKPILLDQLKTCRADDLDITSVSDTFIAEAKAVGTARFRKSLAQVAIQISSILPVGANLLFAHAIAGGVPRARILMPFLNRIFKGIGGPYMSSEEFSRSRLGQLCNSSFNEVTADTFHYLIEETAQLRENVKSAGNRVAYTAYGYHGTGVLIDGEYRWQSYTPYMQGVAKMRLESIACEAFESGISATVFNCPEIQTNSSAFFVGLELSLYPLLTSIRQVVGDSLSAPLFERCQAMLKDGESVEILLQRANEYLSSPILSKLIDFKTWPQENTQEQSALTLKSSKELFAMHKEQKSLVSGELSRIVFLTTGKLMLHTSWSPDDPVIWLNHDIIAKSVGDSLG